MVHKAQIPGLSLSDIGTLVSVGWDDTIAFTEKTYEDIGIVLLVYF